MALRVTAHEVKEIINTSIADNVVKASMITTANILITDTLSSVGHSTAILKLIELYLAAHFVAVTEEHGGLISESFGDAEQKYSDVYGESLNGTRYGQQALAIDTSGLLTALASTKLKARIGLV